MKMKVLYSTAFVSGAVVMTFEMAGSRVVAPFLGTSTYVWTSLIGVVLASLSVGYWLGGHYADRGADLKFIAKVIVLGAIGIGWVIVSKDVVLSLISLSPLGAILNSFVASMLLFAPTSVALGMVSPLVTKLIISDLSRSGSDVGNLYAVSTVGSIVGTFAGGYLLIPFLGTNNILIFLVVSLLLLAFFITPKVKTDFVVASVLIILCFSYYSYQADNILLADVDTSYARVMVFDQENKEGDIVRYMRINNENSSSMFLGSTKQPADYINYFKLDSHFKKEINDTLMIGGAGYSYPKDFLRNYKDAKMDVVEIDPVVTDLAKQYFRLEDNPRLTIIHDDARNYIRETDKKYDVVYSDAFKSSSIPFHLTTKEAIQDMYRIVHDDGVVIVNTIGALGGEKSKFFSAELKTFKSVFPYVYVLPVSEPETDDKIQNIMIISTKQEVLSFVNDDEQLQEYLNHIWTGEIEMNLPVLTDDYAPVDYYMKNLI